MRRPQTHRSFYSKATRIYLVATTAVTVVLLFSGIFSFQRQFKAIRELSVSNIRLQGERVAFEVERRIWELADTCLRDPLTGQMLLDLQPALDRPRAQSNGTAHLAEVRRRHPIVDRLFALGDQRFQFAQALPSGAKTSDEQRDFAETVEQQLRLSGYHVPDRTYAQVLKGASRAYQIFYIQPANSAGDYLGLSVDLDWVRSALLPQCRASVLGAGGVAEQLDMELLDSPHVPDNEPSQRSLAVGFETVLDLWHLRLPLESLDVTKTAVRKEMWFVGVSVLMTSSILILEVFLFFRIFPELQVIQVRSEFISRVSHELRTPLTLIRLYAETLTESPDLSKEEHENYCHIINREAERLTRMINNVLQFSRIEKAQSNMIEADLVAVVQRTLEAYERLLARDGFSIQAALPSGLPPVRFDPEEVTQAVLNLLDNARKYSRDSRVIEVAMWERRGLVAIEVTDHGMGVPADQIARIFEPFYRSPAGAGQAGVGLGLYIVRNIMQGHGGRVEVESAPNEGSRFRLIFPTLRVPAQVLAPRDKRLMARRGLSG
jgi:signal transduction histidine kinase